MRDLFLITVPPGVSVIGPDNCDVESFGNDLRAVSGPPRIFQDVVKVLETGEAENPTIPEYGSVLGNLSGSSNPAGDAADSVKKCIGFLAEVAPSKDPSEKIDRMTLKFTPSPPPGELPFILDVVMANGESIRYARGA